jgi:hypothetical protein
MNIDLLLYPGARFDNSCRQALNSAKTAGLPFRMAEGNSCYNAGKQGVSDTFASALWAGDFCLQMASMGCVGVNLHGGANGFYSPIVGSIASGFAVRPEYYGLMLAQQFAGLTLHRTTLDAQGANLTAYAAGGRSKGGLIAIFNKDAREVVLAEAAHGFKQASVARLEAPAIDSKLGTAFQGAAVGSDGQFHPRSVESHNPRSGKLYLRVQGYSAALIQMS